MTEQEYIDATNLAKLRAAQGILRDFLFQPITDQLTGGHVSEARHRISAAINLIEKKVKTNG